MTQMESSAATAKTSRDALCEEERNVVAADPLVGLTVADRYRILGPIGSGGMGVVYKVEHTRIGKLMAMKLLAGELSRDANLVKRFKREAQLASRLSHANTVQVFDFGQADGLTYLVMELVPGEDLARVVKNEGPLGYLRAARLVVQICGSLAEAHALGIIHRDLKPENILVVGEGKKNEIVKVCDFGLAKLRESAEQNDVTGHGAVVGTPYYMSPEQIRGEDCDARTDIYSLGALMYRIITGAPPFTGQNPMAVFAKHLTETPAPPSVRMPGMGIPKSLDGVLMKALAKKREDRFERIEEMQEELLAILRAGNVSSVDVLVDSSELRKAASEAVESGMESTQLAGVYRQAATRDEVEAFERKLRRQRLLGQLVLAAGLVAIVAGGLRAYTLATAVPRFDGSEREPNDDAGQANAVPFGSDVRGYIGKRVSPSTSDRDFFVYDVPGTTGLAKLKTTALPNFATCTRLYRAGTPDPIARFCTGAAGRDLVVPQLRVEPGRYLVAVLQDTEPYGRDAPPPVLENVSDEYVLSFGETALDPSFEVEPNDAPSVPNRVAVGKEVHGMLAFVRDVDVFCPEENVDGDVRWIVRDAVEKPRDPGAVLEVTADRGAAKDPSRVFVHRAGVAGTNNPTNVVGTYATAPVHVEKTQGSACVTLRLALDPWAQTGTASQPPHGMETYAVRLEAVK